ncbi:MAG: F0F1 ATP synthase subunit epsilon [Anaerolineae bacterium]
MPRTLYLEIVTAERLVYSGPVDSINAPGSDGRLGILPGHVGLLTGLAAGELRLKPRDDDEEISLAIGGGYLEVSGDRVIVLAHSAERAWEIDVERALQARERAVRRIEERHTGVDLDRARAALARAEARVHVVERYRRSHSEPGR